jgi:hypothetical protein
MESHPACSRPIGQAKYVLITGFLVSLLLLACHSGYGQGAPATGSVEGRVTCNDGGFPARSAVVDLEPLSALLGNPQSGSGKVPQAPSTATDFDGNYVVRRVPPGDYLVIPNLRGYSVDFALVLALLHQLTAEQQMSYLASFAQVTVHAGEMAQRDVVIRRGAAISGRVAFDSGGPLEQTFVQATLISSSLFKDADKDMKFAPIQFLSMRGQTDDRGVYRIAGLSPGKYRISVIINHHGASSVAGPLTVFAPEALEAAKATVVELGEGDEIGDMDISIPLRLLHSIAGVIKRDGVPTSAAALELEGQNTKLESSATINPDGSYRFDLLPADTYVLTAEEADTVEGAGGAAKEHKITVQLGDQDVLDANIELGGGAARD